MKQNRFKTDNWLGLLASLAYVCLVSQSFATDRVEGLPESASAMEALLLSEETPTTSPEVEAAEAQLKAAMPFSFLKADPSKLGPALAAAKEVGVDPSLIAEAEAKLAAAGDAVPSSGSLAAEAQLKAAMPFSFLKADPSKLGPALAAAKEAGVDPSLIAEAEAKLAAAGDTAPSSGASAAEAQLKAAMPFSFLKADPSKLGPALAAAKEAGVDPSLIAEAEAKLAAAGDTAPSSGASAAEAQLKAAMPFSFLKADPSKLGPALAAAKEAGVDPSLIAEAEAKLAEAKGMVASADEVVLLVDMPATTSASAPPSGVTVASNEVPTVEPLADRGGQPFLGVGFRDPSNSIVTTLYGGSTAAQLGIKLGDAIVSVNGSSVGDIESLRTILGTMSVGADVTVVVRRQGKEYALGPSAVGGRYQ